MTCAAGRLTRVTVCVLLLAPLTAVFAACAPATRYKVLDFFFDGVPDPAAPPEAAAVPESASAQAAPARVQATAAPRRLIHRPYRENRCNACHDVARAFQVASPPANLCTGCHKDGFSRLRFLHGPVAAGACLVCHHPHDSTRPALLRGEVEAVCFGCHERGAVLAAPDHRAWEENGSVGTCLACHDPHGGDNPMFLKRPRG